MALVGPNGAGKTTLLNTVAGLLRPATGRVRFEGADVTGSEPADLVRAGLALVPEHRRIFKDLTVEENLRLGAATVAKSEREHRLDEAAEVFPVLRAKWDTSAGFLSGGEAQQLAVARALMSNPRLLLLDEPTLGLAPTMVDVVFHLLERLRSDGRTMLVVEQNATRVLSIADRGYVMRTGNIVAEARVPSSPGDPTCSTRSSADRRGPRPSSPNRRGRVLMTQFVQNVIDGLGNGSTYALLALGVSMIFGVMHLVNFAHGELLTIGAYVIYGMRSNDISWWATIPAQNSLRLKWSREEVDSKLHGIMKSIHEVCVRYGKNGDFVNYVDGANIGGFIKVADTMLDFGVL